MDREKQIEEMAEHCFYNEEGNCCVDLHKSVMCEDEAKTCAIYQTLENIYIAGYRKQSEVVKEIFEEIGKLLDNQECITENQRCKEVVDFLLRDYLPRHIAELKKKYIGE